MPLIEWDDAMSVGIGSINEEHKKLIDFINRLDEAMKNGSSKAILGEVLSDLMAHASYHFSHEEELFMKTSYPDKDRHREIHSRLLLGLLDIQSKYRLGMLDQLPVELMVFLKEWLVDHIQGVDMKYIPYLNKE